MSKQKNTDFRTSIGGQALLEGILMRGPKLQAIALRTDEGIKVKTDDLNLIKDKYPVLGWPLIRGVVNFLDSMIKGIQALSYSAEMLPEDQQGEPDKLDLWFEKHFSGETAQKLIIGTALVLGLGLAVLLFIFLPTFIIGLLPGMDERLMLRSLLEGILKLIIFFIYLYLCTRMKDVQRVFAYHGAEHKTIFCYEKRLPLTVENVRPQSRFHPRCGTSFLLVVIILGIFVGFLIQIPNTFARMGLRILLLPVIVAVAYELNRWIGRHDCLLSSVLSWPGKKLQLLTTFEPDDGMIECAIAALQAVIPQTEGEDEW